MVASGWETSKKIMKSMGRILQTHFGCGLVGPKALLGCTCQFYDTIMLQLKKKHKLFGVVLTTDLFHAAPLKVNCRKDP